MVKEAGIEAVPYLAEIYQLSFNPEEAQIWSEQDLVTLMKVPGTKVYVAIVEEEPVGFSMIREVVDEAEIITFCILPNKCNNGYATLLLEWIIKRLQMQSFKRLFLEVRENNISAIRLYNKCSFENIGRRKGYYNSSRKNSVDALVMQIKLS